MDQTIGAARVRTLVGDFDRDPAYAGLADALVLLIGDGRLPCGARLPSERALTAALGVSRTTVTRAYDALRAAGYARARRGAGTYTAVPGGRGRFRDRALTPWAGESDVLDLSCAADSAPPGVAAAYADAVAALPAYLGGHGYFPAGLPELQAAIAAAYDAQGLATDPAQVIVTSGALCAAAVVARGLVERGAPVLVESPVYPNATEALREAGARLVATPVDPDGWDLDALDSAARRSGARLAYLVPDFQNPTGQVMEDEDRARVAACLRDVGTVPVVDEAHRALVLDDRAMPAPFASYLARTVTIGSASKAFWGGLRLGWIRAPHDLVAPLMRARVAMDLGAPVVEQLALTRLLADGPVPQAHLQRLREQRAALVDAVADQLPTWRSRRPAGGLALWCELPSALGSALTAEAERRGVILTPGPVFAVDGGLDRYVRLPWTRPVGEIEESVRRVAEAWATVTGAVGAVAAPDPRAVARVMVA